MLVSYWYFSDNWDITNSLTGILVLIVEWKIGMLVLLVSINDCIADILILMVVLVINRLAS